MTPLPTVDEVRMLPATLTTAVEEEFIDENGHMNIRHYVRLEAKGAGVISRDVGFTSAYRSERRMSVFTAEHHLKYFAELRLGERISVHPRVLDRSDKTLHMMALMIDDTNDLLVNTLELVLVHVDLNSRRATRMPAEITARIDGYLAEHGALPWAPPVTGHMGVRR
ncbi:MAG: hypothetical protein JWR35_779 [Marmoricola sp.]|jgi:acyl-CoA thioester hydrolase|nr:hypothetical protein [Marmoricola sp.]